MFSRVVPIADQVLDLEIAQRLQPAFIERLRDGVTPCQLGAQGLELLLDLPMHLPVSAHRLALVTGAEADCDVVSFFRPREGRWAREPAHSSGCHASTGSGTGPSLSRSCLTPMCDRGSREAVLNQISMQKQGTEDALVGPAGLEYR